MSKILGIIIGVIMMIALGTFAWCACVVSSKISKYEDYDRGDLDK